MRAPFLTAPTLTLAALTACTQPSPAPVDAASDANDVVVDRAPDVVDDVGMDAPAGPRPTLVVLTDSDRDTRFTTMEHMLAAFEMQLSGEPFAQAMGRQLAGYDRFMLPPNQYRDPALDAGAPVIDLAGFSTAVESYEYSKMPMNMLAFESTAGTSLAHAPLVNPMGVTGADAMQLLRDRVQRYALASHAGVMPTGDAGVSMAGFVTVPAPTDNELNRLGFGGFWPTVHPFRSFDPTIAPSRGATRGCSLTGGYGASAGMAQVVGDYECGYSTLHLSTNRGDPLSIERAISPGASSWAAWKYGLWAINYLQLMHDGAGNTVASVPDAELGNVGRPGNTVAGTRQGGGRASGGVWLASTDLEGMQAAFMLESIDAQAHQWITGLSTTDGVNLDGFATVRDALAYDYAAPLRWVPSLINYGEERDLAYGFHRPVRYAIGRSDSSLMELLGMLGAFTETFALTDRRNTEVGGAQSARAYFDGDPFAADNQMPDGEATLHDRALAVAKLALVDIDRMHRDPSTGALVDTVTFVGPAPTRGATVSAVSTAWSVVALRQARRALAGRLTLYSNTTPDTAVTATALDGTSMRGAPGDGSVAQRLNALIGAQASLLYDHLTDATGRAWPGWNVVSSQPTSSDERLDAYAAAVRGLLEASLATGDTRYQYRAEAVYRRMETQFYVATTRAWRAAPGDSAQYEYTPLRFALLQAALREMYKLVASAPGREALARTIEQHVARLHKLVLNGWDDRNDDGLVDWPAECIFRLGSSPRGGLQMAERALTGETGAEGTTVLDDRDHDCVPEIGAANLPATLASRLRITVRTP